MWQNKPEVKPAIVLATFLTVPKGCGIHPVDGIFCGTCWATGKPIGADNWRSVMRCNQARTVRVLGSALFFIAFQTGFFSTACAPRTIRSPHPAAMDWFGARVIHVCWNSLTTVVKSAAAPVVLLMHICATLRHEPMRSMRPGHCRRCLLKLNLHGPRGTLVTHLQQDFIAVAHLFAGLWPSE